MRLQSKKIGNGPSKGESLINTLDQVAKDGKTRIFADTWDDIVRVPIHSDIPSLDFDLTVGSSQLTSVGSFEVSKDGDGMLHIKGTVHHFISQNINGVKQAYDMVDFNPGEQFPPKWLAGLAQRFGIPTLVNTTVQGR